MTTERPAGFSTRCVHAGDRLDSNGGTHRPLYNHATFGFPSIEDSMVRLSCGLEDAEDLWADLQAALG